MINTITAILAITTIVTILGVATWAVLTNKMD